AISIVGKIIVDVHMIELSCWQIFLRPCPSSIESNGCAAIIADDKIIGIVGIDPHVMIIAVLLVKCCKCFSAVDRLPELHVHYEYMIFIFWIYPYAAEIPGTLCEVIIR